ncbi:TLC domain-containing protein [Balamuthia mandrillaris]
MELKRLGEVMMFVHSLIVFSSCILLATPSERFLERLCLFGVLVYALHSLIILRCSPSFRAALLNSMLLHHVLAVLVQSCIYWCQEGTSQWSVFAWTELGTIFHKATHLIPSFHPPPSDDGGERREDDGKRRRQRSVLQRLYQMFYLLCYIFTYAFVIVYLASLPSDRYRTRYIHIPITPTALLSPLATTAVGSQASSGYLAVSTGAIHRALMPVLLALLCYWMWQSWLGTLHVFRCLMTSEESSSGSSDLFSD